MDKYEEAAISFNERYPMMQMPEGYLSEALRDFEERRDKETCETLQEQSMCKAQANLIARDLASISHMVLQRAYSDALELARTIEIQFATDGQPIALGRRLTEREMAFISTRRIVEKEDK